MDTVELIGYFATVMTTICYIPQVMQIYKTKEVAAISLGMYCALTVGIGSWLVYSIMLSLTPLIICNALCLLMIIAILSMKIIYSKRSVSELLAADVNDIVNHDAT